MRLLGAVPHHPPPLIGLNLQKKGNQGKCTELFAEAVACMSGRGSYAEERRVVP
jgi:hypothetical protein